MCLLIAYNERSCADVNVYLMLQVAWIEKLCIVVVVFLCKEVMRVINLRLVLFPWLVFNGDVRNNGRQNE